MRRVLVEKEEAPTRLTPIPQGASESVAGQLPEQEAAQKNKKAAPVLREKSSPTKGKFLKAAIITFASLGIIGALVPLFTGAPAGETAQFLDLKKAYSPNNLTYLRGTAALKLGLYDAAIGTFKALPRLSSEQIELSDPLFTQLLEAQEYGRAIQMLDHLNQKNFEGGYISFAQGSTEYSSQQRQTFERIGGHMGVTLGLEAAMAKLEQEPALAANRSLLLRPLFFMVAPNEMAALQKLAPTLPLSEQTAATEAILAAYTRQGDWNSAWQWTLTQPTELRHKSLEFVLDGMAYAAPQQAVERLASLRNTPDYMRGFSTVFRMLSNHHPKIAVELLDQLESPVLRDKAIRGLLSITQNTSRQFTLKEILVLLDRQTDPTIKAQTLAGLTLTAKQEMEPGGKEFALTQIEPRLVALARQNQALVALHDAYLIDSIRYAYQVSKELKTSYADRILDPALRAAAQKELAGGTFTGKYPSVRDVLGKTYDTRFSLIDLQK